jgi:hypothetical protein
MIRTPAQIVTDTARQWLELPDDLLPVIPLVVAVANALPGEPIWLVIVAPPSSGKSDLIMGVSGIKGAYALSSLTPRTFASGLRKADNGKAPSLLDRLSAANKWLLTFKDLGTVQNLSPNDRNEVWGQLREIYDGQFDKAFGTGEEVHWHGKLGLLAGATPRIDEASRWSVELGERFVYFRPTVPAPERVARKAREAAGKEGERRAALKLAYASGFARATNMWQVMQRKGDDALAPEAVPVVDGLAQFIAEARRPVKRERANYDTSFQVAPPEGPGRLTKIFTQLHRGAMIVLGGDLEAANRLVIRVAVDSIPGKRRDVLRQFSVTPEGVTRKSIARMLGCDENTAERELENLQAIRLADVDTPAGKVKAYRPSYSLLDYADRITLDQLDESVAALARVLWCTAATRRQRRASGMKNRRWRLRVLRGESVQGHNYLPALLQLVEQHPELAGSLAEVWVQHDDWCDLLNGRGLCKCDPWVTLRRRS